MLYAKTPLDWRKEWIDGLRNFKGIQSRGHPCSFDRKNGKHCGLSLLAHILGDDTLSYTQLMYQIGLPNEIAEIIWKKNDGVYDGWTSRPETFKEIANYIESLPVKGEY